jgi:bifunctional non-homologous end joining protein LigD
VFFDPRAEETLSIMLIPQPLPLHRESQPFDDPNWIYEIRHDAVRALAVIERGTCRLLSGDRHKLYGFRDLRLALVHELNAVEAVLDGALAIRGAIGGMQTSRTNPHRTACYHAFDLVWLDGQDLRAQPLLSRKEQLRLILPVRSAHVLYVDHARGAGQRLYQLACEMDLEGIVARRADSPYELQDGPSSWVTILNPSYSRKERKGALLKRPA